MVWYYTNNFDVREVPELYFVLATISNPRYEGGDRGNKVLRFDLTSERGEQTSWYLSSHRDRNRLLSKSNTGARVVENLSEKKVEVGSQGTMVRCLRLK